MSEKKAVYLLSGTPGTGKTSITQILGDNGYSVISLTETVNEYHLYTEFDEKRDTKVIDESAVRDKVFELIESSPHEKIVIDGHYADLIDHPYVLVGIVLRTHPLKLQERLEARGYFTAKIRENLHAELVGDCASYMMELTDLLEKDCLFEIDTTHQDLKNSADLIDMIFQNPTNYHQYSIGNLSWLSDPDVPIDLLKLD